MISCSSPPAGSGSHLQSTFTDVMWKRGIQPVQLLARSRRPRILSCCHQCRDQLTFRAQFDPRFLSVRNTWNWATIKPNPSNPFFSQRSTKNTPRTAFILLRNADIPMLQIKPPVFIPANSEQGEREREHRASGSPASCSLYNFLFRFPDFFFSLDLVQHSLNILLFMSDFNTEPRPLAVNALACSATGLIHYLQIANDHLSLVLPTYNITNGGRNPELLPSLVKTFLESPSYTKIGFGAYEDAARIKDQYGIACKNMVDTHWDAKVMGIGTTNVEALHRVFGDIHDAYIPGRIDSEGNVSNVEQEDQLIDPRRWDWESHGSVEISRELVRCIAQDAFATLKMYDNIVDRKFRPGYQPPLTDIQKLSGQALEFLLTSVPRGTVRSRKKGTEAPKLPISHSCLTSLNFLFRATLVTSCAFTLPSSKRTIHGPGYE